MAKPPEMSGKLLELCSEEKVVPSGRIEFDSGKPGKETSGGKKRDDRKKVICTAYHNRGRKESRPKPPREAPVRQKLFMWR